MRTCLRYRLISRQRVTSIALALLALLTITCTTNTSKILYTAECNGHILQLKLVSEQTFETEYNHHELTYDDKVVDVIDYGRLSSRPPYYPEVYGSTPWYYIDTTRQSYQPKGFVGPVEKIPAMLFVDTTQWTPQQFEQLYACVKQHSKPAQASMMQEEKFQPYQFGGMVYGREADFVKKYVKTKDDYFEVYPDGRIIHTLTESLGMTTQSSNGLSNSVLMPGKRILVDTAHLPLQKLGQYRNPQTNRRLQADFRIEIDTVFHSR